MADSGLPRPLARVIRQRALAIRSAFPGDGIADGRRLFARREEGRGGFLSPYPGEGASRTVCPLQKRHIAPEE